MSRKIEKLPPEVVKKIAAGEVIERPASIVKELIENSLDAGAKKVSIEIKNGGLDLIRVSDDGSGINKTDLLLTTELHATSKLTDISDLESINSFGFRGEALASIAAAATVEIISAVGDELAYKLTEGGGIENASRGIGTTIEVKDLFRNIPARKKFLKSLKTEEGYIRNVIKQFAISFPEVSFNYTADDKAIYNFFSDSMLNRISQLFNIANVDLLPLEFNSELINIQGYIGHPKIALTRAHQYIYINDRIIKSPLIISASKKAFSKNLPPDLNPLLFLKFTITGKEIDINIHPRKEEVKFSSEGEIYKLVLHALNQELTTILNNQFKERFTNSQDNVTKIVNSSLPPQDYSPVLAFADRSVKTNNYANSKSTMIQKSLQFSKNLIDINPTFSLSPEIEDHNYLQIFKTYIVLAKDNKLLIIDQHAADERVNYEKWLAKLINGKIESTPLLISHTVSLPLGLRVDSELLKGFQKFGFELEEFGEIDGIWSLKIIAVPIMAIKLNISQIVSNIFSDLYTEKIDLSNLESSLNLICATIACHISIRAGQSLNTVQITKLIIDLWNTKDPYNCPHGRPIIWELEKANLAKNFMRTK